MFLKLVISTASIDIYDVFSYPIPALNIKRFNNINDKGCNENFGNCRHSRTQIAITFNLDGMYIGTLNAKLTIFTRHRLNSKFLCLTANTNLWRISYRCRHSRI